MFSQRGNGQLIIDACSRRLLLLQGKIRCLTSQPAAVFHSAHSRLIASLRDQHLTGNPFLCLPRHRVYDHSQ